MGFSLLDLVYKHQTATFEYDSITYGIFCLTLLILAFLSNFSLIVAHTNRSAPVERYVNSLKCKTVNGVISHVCDKYHISANIRLISQKHISRLKP